MWLRNKCTKMHIAVIYSGGYTPVQEKRRWVGSKEKEHATWKRNGVY